MLAAILLGFVFGFVGSMPVAGPIAVLVFGRGLEGRLRSGVYLALGAAIAESVYAYVAYWGIGALLTSHRWIDLTSRALAAVILIVLGARFAFVRNRQERAEVASERPNVGNKRSFLLGFTITALNPALIATWSAAVTTLHSFDVVSFEAKDALPFSLGVLAGIGAWFSLLLFFLGRFRGRFQRSTLDRIIQVMGYFLIALGLYFAVKFFRSFV
jgi:threonine/homoserine/homoserine lactone efflux protein